jgi:hypothetical protein
LTFEDIINFPLCFPLPINLFSFLDRLGEMTSLTGFRANGVGVIKRERSRSPRRRSRSPRRRRSYSRSRSRSREDYRRSERRSRSPMSGAPGASGGYSGSGYGGRGGAAPPARSFEERAAAKEQMMQSLRDSSQQDRRVYVGNLSYDVKWHHLKDFMRQGKLLLVRSLRYEDEG